MVTCYSNIGYTRNWTPSQASYHVPHLKLCRNLSSRTITEPKPPSAHHTPLGGTELQTAWWASHTARRHAPAVPSQYRHRLAGTTMPPSALLYRHRLAEPSPAARHPVPAVTTITDLIPVCLAARSCHQALYQWHTTTSILALIQIPMDLTSYSTQSYKTIMTYQQI